MRKGVQKVLLFAFFLLLVTGLAVLAGCPCESRQAAGKSSCSRQDSTKPLYDVRVEKDVSYLGPERAEKCDFYMPADADKEQRFPGIVIIHGGGWMLGDKGKAREQNIGTTLARQGYVCISINYLLAEPNKPSWPQSIYDCKSAVQFLRKNAQTYHIDPNHIGVIGGSAGGHLAAMVGLVGPEVGLEPPAPYKGISSRVQAVVALYGAFDLSAFESKKTDKPRISVFLGASREDNPNLWALASPVNHISRDDPPFLVLHGTADKVIDYKQSVELDEKLRQNGVETQLVLIEGAPHTFDLQPEQKDLRPLVIGFFDRNLKSKTVFRD